MTRSPASPRRIVIIGGGFSGATLARALIANSDGGLALTVVEPRPILAGGVAYSTTEPAHYVNAPASILSIHPDKPDHFARWLDAYVRDGAIAADDWRDGADTYAPRGLYGQYVRSELDVAIAAAGDKVSFAHVRGKAVDIHFDHAHAQVGIEHGAALSADHVVLASGVPGARPFFESEALVRSPAYLADPWRSEAYARFADAKRVAIIGAGLTMLDALVSLDRAGFRGVVQVISRHGLPVWTRRSVQAWPGALDPQDLPVSARDLLRGIQRTRKAIGAAGADWQALPAAVAPHVETIWQRANDSERQIYLRRLRAFWEITRHRAAPPTGRLADAWRAAGRLRSGAAHIVDVAPVADGTLAVKLRLRKEIEPRSLGFDGVINAIGPEYNIRRAAETNVLFANLLKSGAIWPGPSSFGIDALQDGAVINRAGVAHRNLSALGPLLRGVHWESNAIPEILPQVHTLASRLVRGNERARAVA
jgi:uncharacterized NAD(P)/FAD-binding protein YdhS